MTSRVVNAMLITFASILLMLAGYGLVQFAQPVQAASSGKYQEPGTCVKFATVGSFDQYHCVDPAGNEYDTNTAGFMLSAGN